MYRDQFGEFVCGYWGLKGYKESLFFFDKGCEAFMHQSFEQSIEHR